LQQVNTDLMKEIFERTAAEDALRESEARLIQFLEALPVGVFVMDARAKPFYANTIAKKLVGADFQPDDQPEELLRRYHLYVAGTDQIYPFDRLPIVRAIGGEVITASDIEIRRPDTVLPLHAMAAPIFDASGKVQYAIMACSDISELKKVDRLKSEFISTVSHELRTPLTSIRGSLELIAAGIAGELPVQAKALADIAYKNTERLLHLINDILDIEKIESGKLALHPEVLDLRLLVEQVLETNRAYGDQFAVTFVLEQPVPQAQVYTDNQRLMQVLANLLSNAAKFSPPSDTVHIALSRRGGTVRVAITDHGPGIPEEFRGHIFSKFAQADSSDTRQKGGTGLGLSISKALIERLGGRIGFTTQPHIATTFYVELPEWRPFDLQVTGSLPHTEHTSILPPTGNPLEHVA
jgi:PAS domain S-box-containing protein